MGMCVFVSRGLLLIKECLKYMGWIGQEGELVILQEIQENMTHLVNSESLPLQPESANHSTIHIQHIPKLSPKLY